MKQFRPWPRPRNILDPFGYQDALDKELHRRTQEICEELREELLESRTPLDLPDFPHLEAPIKPPPPAL